MNFWGSDTKSDTEMTTKHRYNNQGRAATKSFLVSDNTCVSLYCTRIIKCHVLLTAATATESESESVSESESNNRKPKPFPKLSASTYTHTHTDTHRIQKVTTTYRCYSLGSRFFGAHCANVFYGDLKRGQNK